MADESFASQLDDIVKLLKQKEPEVRHAALVVVRDMFSGEKPKLSELTFLHLLETLMEIDKDGRNADREIARAVLTKLRKIRVKIQAVSGVTYSVFVDVLKPVAHLQLHLEDVRGIACDSQVLIFAGTTLKFTEPIHHYKIVPDSTIHLVHHNKGQSLTTQEEAQWTAFSKEFFAGRVTPASELAKHEYKFNSNLELRHINTQHRYEWKTQEIYNSIGEIVGDYLEEFFVKEFKFVRFRIPTDADPDDKTVSVLMSRGALECPHLAVFVPTAGNIRMGMWVRGMCINESLYAGSMIDYVKEALILGLGVLLLNPNQPVAGNRTPAEHVAYAFTNLITHTPSTSVSFIAHQVGGDCLVHMLRRNFNFFRDKVIAVAFIDSTHGIDEDVDPADFRNALNTKARAWCLSEQYLDSVVNVTKYGCGCYASGTSKPMLVPSLVKNSVFEWLKTKYANRLDSNVIAKNRALWTEKDKEIRKHLDSQ